MDANGVTCEVTPGAVRVGSVYIEAMGPNFIVFQLNVDKEMMELCLPGKSSGTHDFRLARLSDDGEEYTDDPMTVISLSWPGINVGPSEGIWIGPLVEFESDSIFVAYFLMRLGHPVKIVWPVPEKAETVPIGPYRTIREGALPEVGKRKRRGSSEPGA